MVAHNRRKSSGQQQPSLTTSWRQLKKKNNNNVCNNKLVAFIRTTSRRDGGFLFSLSSRRKFPFKKKKGKENAMTCVHEIAIVCRCIFLYITPSAVCWNKRRMRRSVVKWKPGNLKKEKMERKNKWSQLTTKRSKDGVDIAHARWVKIPLEAATQFFWVI